jgi:hypothetical protein
MVRGLDIFKKYFAAYPDQYVIIGGTACDIILGAEGFKPRVTKDIDIILVVEALHSDFVSQFWLFIKDGNYARKEKSDNERQYYRFTKPENDDFPQQIELFARNPDLIGMDEETHLTPIPVDDDLSSLSAILLDDDYYNYVIEHSQIEDGVRRADTESLICLKAKAYFEIKDRIEKGGKEDAKHLKKHKGDVFRLGVTMGEEDIHELPQRLKEDMQNFFDEVKDDLPGKEIFKEMGVGKIDSEVVYLQLMKSFGLN